MEESYHQDISKMTYYQLLRFICGNDKEYRRVRKNLDPLLKRIGEKWHGSN